MVSRADARVAGVLAAAAVTGPGARAPGPAPAGEPPAPIAAPSRAGGATTARIVATTHARPRPGGRRRVARLGPVTGWSHQAQTLLVLGSARHGGREWLQVRLPVRPNGVTGWILRSKALLGHTRRWLDLRLRDRRLTVYRDGRRSQLQRRRRRPGHADAARAGRGLRAQPPAGRRGFLGPWALSLTALSDVLESYGGGPGRIAIHGRGGASLRDPLGSARSHGCVRIDNAAVTWLARRVPPGTPVRIRR